METARGHEEHSPGSNLGLFLRSLISDGRPLVSAEPPGAFDEECRSLLGQLDLRAREELGLEAPDFSGAAAAWAAGVLYNACRFVTCRDLGEEEIVRTFAVPCPDPRCAQTDWSVDLVLRHLPRVCQLARHLSQADPLNRELKKIASNWPLSSVGVPGLSEFNLDSFIGHPALRRLYGDRILAAEDTSRIGDARVDDLLRADLGLHHELAPLLASKLFPADAGNLSTQPIA